MNTIKHTSSKLHLTIGLYLACSLSGSVYAQNSSYNANAVPVNGSSNAAFGSGALAATAPASYANAAVGINALRNNTTGTDNTATGAGALFANVTGSYNSAFGSDALWSNKGERNSAFGYQALTTNTTGNYNTALGFTALTANSTGTANTGTGYQALHYNTTGSYNTAAGYGAMYATNGAGYNAAVGAYSLYQNITGQYNAALGYQALYGATSSNNTSIGFRSLYLSTSGPNNTAIGFAALYNNSTGGSNTALGYSADVSAGNLSNATAIGNSAVVNASDKIRLGNATVTVVEGPVAYTFSDGRFKTNVTEEVKGLEFINKLRPVVYNLDTRKITEAWTKNMTEEQRKQYMSQDFTASTNIRQTGFIAQEVEQAAKAANYDFNGVHVPANDNDNYSVAYAEFVVPLVKGMQEQQQLIEQLQQELRELKQQQNATTSLEQNFMTDASLEQNVPNPFTHETVIRFTLPAQVSTAFLTVYDLQGKQIKTMPIKDRGNSSVTFTAGQLAAGMYIYSIIADGKIVGSKRMVIADR